VTQGDSSRSDVSSGASASSSSSSTPAPAATHQAPAHQHAHSHHKQPAPQSKAAPAATAPRSNLPSWANAVSSSFKSNPVLEENGSSSTSSPLSRNWGQMSDAIPIPPPRRNDLSLPRGPSKVFLGSLPVNTTEEDISHFFSGLMIKTNGIELHTDGGRFKGSAFVFFETHDEVQKGLLKFLSHCIAFSHSPVGLALQKNGSYFKGKKVQVSIAKLK